MRNSKYRTKDMRRMVLVILIIVIIVVVAGGIAAWKGFLFVKPKVEQTVSDASLKKTVKNSSYRPWYYNGHTYMIVSRDEQEMDSGSLETRVYEEEAIAYCEDLGAHMLTIDSAEENNEMYTYLARYGVADASISPMTGSDETGYQWSNGESVVYTNWVNTEQDLAVKAEDLEGISEGRDYGAVCNQITSVRDGNEEQYTGGIWARLHSDYFICEWDEEIDLEEISLLELDYTDYSGSILQLNSDGATDSMGNEYETSLYVDGEDANTYYVTFDLNQEYSVLTGVVSYVGSQDVGKYVMVYLDDMLIFSSNIMYPDSEPQSFTINVTGISTLRIEYPPTEGQNKMATLFDLTLK